MHGSHMRNSDAYSHLTVWSRPWPVSRGPKLKDTWNRTSPWLSLKTIYEFFHRTADADVLCAPQWYYKWNNCEILASSNGTRRHFLFNKVKAMFNFKYCLSGKQALLPHFLSQTLIHNWNSHVIYCLNKNLIVLKCMSVKSEESTVNF